MARKRDEPSIFWDDPEHALRIRERQRRSNWIKRFADEQRRRREWINFGEVADWCSELGGRAERDEARRANAYDWLTQDLLAGDFDESGASRVRFLHPAVTAEAMTRKRVSDCGNEIVMSLPEVLETSPAHVVRSEYLAFCWLPRRMFERWLAKHELPASPARFEPHSPAESTPLHPDRLSRMPPGWRGQGRRPIKLEQTKEAMRRDIQAGQMTPAKLTEMLEKDLASTYNVSRNTARKARKAVLSEFVPK
jgi:hypothetical protein